MVTSPGPFDMYLYSIAVELDTFFRDRFLCLANIFKPPVETVFILDVIYSNIHTHIYIYKCIYLYRSNHRPCCIMFILYSTTTVVLQRSIDLYYDTMLFIHI